MKKIVLAIIVWTTLVNGWEINTHRAIDKSAMEKTPNLTSFIVDSKINDYEYTVEESQFASFRN